MSDPPKSSPFSIGQTTTGGAARSVFSQQASDQAKPSNKPFTFDASTSSPSTSSPSLFGQNNQVSSGFTSGTSSNGPLFGSGRKENTGSFDFNAKPTVGGTTNNSSTNQNGSFNGQQTRNASLTFPSFGTSNKASEPPTPDQSQTSGFLGGSAIGNTSLFGSSNTATSNSVSTPASTPINKPTPSFAFNPSTTPAGPPPSNNTPESSSSLFSNPNNPLESKLSSFGSSETVQSTAQDPKTVNAPFSPFGALSKPSGPLFGSNNPSGPSTSSANVQENNSLFDKLESKNFNQSSISAQAGSGFLSSSNKKENQVNENSTASRSTNFPTIIQQSQAASTQPSSLFSNLSTQSSNNAPVTSISSAPFFSANLQNTPTTSSKPSLFATSPLSSVASSQAPEAPSTSTSLFNVSGSKKKSETSVSSSSALSSNLISSSSKPNDNMFKNGVTPANPSATPASTTKPSFFGTPGQSSTTPTPNQQTAQAKLTDSSANPSASTTNLSASTTGPQPTAQSRLKNKSMDEIITRWASDLSKYQKDFQKQAEKVSTWDHMLVENSEKIQKLYGSTLEAERATAEVERQLAAVENDQSELQMWLDYYEKDVDQMMSNQVGQGDSLLGPDQEREKTYKLAERLSSQLEEMGKDLAGMIEEINETSSNISKTNKADDPLSQVVRVLNNHLLQLQQIDQGATALQTKLNTAKTYSNALGASNSFKGSSSNAADGFYRSYMGRR